MFGRLFGNRRRTPRGDVPLPEQPSARREQRGGQLFVTWQDGECRALDKAELSDVAVVAQAVDNQWVSRDLLRRMLGSRRRLTLDDVALERDKAVRAEYLRALVNADQLVINRAFLYNTPVVARDYLEEGPSRLAMLDLLGRGVIVPFLFAEETPADVPRNWGDPHAPNFSLNKRAFAAWARACREVQTRCVRLSWDDVKNRNDTDLLGQRFTAFATNLHLPMATAGWRRYMQDLGVPLDQRERFQARLMEVARWCIQPQLVRREELYKQFVVVDGTNPVVGMYDPRKPYVAALKQLFDLSYGVNLPDALGRYALTPIDSLPRTALQELTVRVEQAKGGNVIAVDELQTLLRQFVFATVQGGAYLRSMGELALEDVVAVRGTDEWAAYIESMRALLRDPLTSFRQGAFQQNARTVYERYARLAEVMTTHVTRRRPVAAVERWMPWATLIITIGGAVLMAAIVPPDAGFGASVLYNVVGSEIQNGAGVVARLLIRGAAGTGAQADLETSIDFFRGELAQMAGREPEVLDLLRNIDIPGFRREENLEAILAQRDENINFAETFRVPALRGAA